MSGWCVCYAFFCGNNELTMKVLNLYSGIGGNRKLWQNVEVTAVEQNAEIAKIYSDFFPNDEMIVGDAHQYLLEHFAEYKFIWSSPPCPTHSRARFWGSHRADTKEVYPDMVLYQEIIFLKHFAKGLWVVENVRPYYKPLIAGKQIDKHLFWSNYTIPITKAISVNVRRDSIAQMQNILGISLDGKYPKMRKDKILRNCVHPELGLHVFNCAIGAIPPMQEGLFAEDESKKHA